MTLDDLAEFLNQRRYLGQTTWTAADDQSRAGQPMLFAGHIPLHPDDPTGPQTWKYRLSPVRAAEVVGHYLNDEEKARHGKPNDAATAPLPAGQRPQ